MDGINVADVYDTLPPAYSHINEYYVKEIIKNVRRAKRNNWDTWSTDEMDQQLNDIDEASYRRSLSALANSNRPRWTIVKQFK